MKIRRRVVVRGLVQGVNYRYHTMMNAELLGVTGWVRNVADGAVEGCFEGEPAAVEALITWCRKGPDWARVDEVSVEQEEYRGEFTGFSIKR